MALGISTESSGQFIPYLKYDARAGRWFRAKNKDAGETQDMDVTHNFAAALDLANIQVGWLLYPKGAAPVYVVQDVSKGLPDKPGKDYKQGFTMKVALNGGEVFEFSSTSKATISAIDELHTLFMADARGTEKKMVPVVEMVGTEIVETQAAQGVTRNYKPTLKIVDWVQRPAAFDAAPARQSAPQATQGSLGLAQAAQQVRATPPATGSVQMQPPANSGAQSRSFG